METIKNKQPKTGWSRLLEIAGTKKTLVVMSLVLSILASIASFVPYVAIYYIIQEILHSYPNFALLDTVAIISYGQMALTGLVGNILLYFLALTFSHLAAFGTLYELKINFATHIAKVPLGFHVLVGSGKLRKIMDENIEKVEEFIAHQLPDLVSALVAPIVMIILLLSFNLWLGLAAIVAILISLAIQIAAFSNKNSREMMARYQGALEEMNNAAVEYVRGISVVKAFRQTVYSFRHLHETIQNYTKLVIPYTLLWENYMSLFSTLINNIYLFIIPIAIFLGINTTDYTAFANDLIFYLLFTPAIASILMKVMYVSNSGIRIIDNVSKMDNYLAKEPLSVPKSPKTVDTYDISFENVVFSYEQTDKTTALNGVTFTALQGETTAIVGPSGGGKSTIAHLIPRFFDVNEGSIKLGGVDIKDIDPDYLMGKVSFVFQDIFLFKQSIKENIKMGNISATDEEIINAAKAAQCHNFIQKLPNGYDTVIGTKGVHLSGGEKQRIAIARAIVKNAPVVVLDEATAFSDPENEHMMQKAFEILMKDKTVIMIAHRLSTVRSANKTVVVENGKVIQTGTHDNLVMENGRYKEMWETYAETSKWKMRSKSGKEVISNA